jgi:nucleoside-diphosphate-sugar epimerase
MNVLVSGAGGFVGRALCTTLLAAGCRVYGTSRDEGADFLPEVVKVVWRGGDKGLEAVSQIDAVVHLAARVHVMRESVADPLAEFRSANVESTRKLASWAANTGVKRFVFMSSIKVNGEATETGRAFSADDLPAPEDAYAFSKLEAEKALRAVCSKSGMQFVVIRSPLVYGSGVQGNFRFMVQSVKRGIPLPLGAISNRRSLVALDNLVSFIMACLEHPAAADQVFLISDGDAVSTTELLRKIALAHAVAPRLFAVPKGWLFFVAGILGKSSAVDRLLGSLEVDDSKARDLLGWRPVVTMDEQLRKMALDDARS